jgi:hypothetical protein
MLHQMRKGLLESSPKLLKNKVAWDRIELPTRGFSDLFLSLVYFGWIFKCLFLL